MKISENVAVLSLPYPMPGSKAKIHPVLTWDDINLVLIDTGFPQQGELFLKAIADAGHDPSKLTHIIITHQDLDHVGSMQELRKAVPGVKVLAHKDEAPYLDGRMTPAKLAPMVDKYDSLSPEEKEGVNQAKEMYKNLQVKFDQELQDKDVLPICGGIEVVHTPGHTPGHITLFLQQSRIMVTGDGANVTDGQISGPNPVHTLDMELATKSLCKIKEYPLAGIVAYHGGYLKVD